MLAAALCVSASAGADWTGVVRDDRGLPVEGARVRLLYLHDASGYGARWIGETRTDKGGAFRLRRRAFQVPTFAVGSPVLQLRLVVTAPGRAAAVDIAAPCGGSKHTFHLEPGCRVVCRVRDARGRPAAETDVSVLDVALRSVRRTLAIPGYSRHLCRALFRGRTDAKGRVVLEHLPVHSWPYLWGANAESGCASQRVNAELGKAALSLEDRRAVADGRAFAAEGGAPLKGLIVAWGDGASWTVTDANGWYRTPPRRRAQIRVRVKGRHPDAMLVRDPRPVPRYAAGWAAPTRDGKSAEARLGKGVLVSGIARNAETKRPAAGVGVYLSLRLGGESHVILHRVTDPSGRFAFRVTGAKARLGLRAGPPGYRIVGRALRKKLALGGRDVEADLAARLQREVSLPVRVTDADGRAAGGVTVLGWVGWGPARVVRSGPDGLATLRGVASGESVTVHAADAEERRAALETFRAGDGRKPRTLRLRPARAGSIVLRDENGAPLRGKVEAYLTISTRRDKKRRAVVLARVHAPDAAKPIRVNGLLPDVDYQVRGYVRGRPGTRTCKREWRFDAADLEPTLELRTALRVPRAPRRRRAPDPKEEARRKEQEYAAALVALKRSQWRRRDPFDKSLTWHGEELTLVDAKGRRVRRFPGLFGHRRLRAFRVAFAAARVYVATDRGVFVWDRKGRFWNPVPIEGNEEVRVRDFEALKDRWRMTVQSEGGKRSRREFHPETGKWTAK